MKAQFVAAAIFLAASAPALAQDLNEIARFAQSICGDIPSGSLTRTTIQGKVQANASTFSKIVGSSGEISTSTSKEIYDGIPFEKLPQSIPTVSMCKTELVKLLVAAIISNKKDSGAPDPLEAQNALLSLPLGVTTPIERIRLVYGPPSKVLQSGKKDGLKLSFYDGVGHRLLFVTKNNSNTGKFAIFRDNTSKSPINIPFLGSEVFSDYTLKYISENCNGAKPTEPDARYVFFGTGMCYFGRSGGYQSYYFGYSASEMNCKIDFWSWDGKKDIKALGCDQKSLNILPEFVFISPDEKDNILAFRLYTAAYWWDNTDF